MRQHSRRDGGRRRPRATRGIGRTRVAAARVAAGARAGVVHSLGLIYQPRYARHKLLRSLGTVARRLERAAVDRRQTLRGRCAAGRLNPTDRRRRGAGRSRDVEPTRIDEQVGRKLLASRLLCEQVLTQRQDGRVVAFVRWILNVEIIHQASKLGHVVAHERVGKLIDNGLVGEACLTAGIGWYGGFDSPIVDARQTADVVGPGCGRVERADARRECAQGYAKALLDRTPGHVREGFCVVESALVPNCRGACLAPQHRIEWNGHNVARLAGDGDGDEVRSRSHRGLVYRAVGILLHLNGNLANFGGGATDVVDARADIGPLRGGRGVQRRERKRDVRVLELLGADRLRIERVDLFVE